MFRFSVLFIYFCVVSATGGSDDGDNLVSREEKESAGLAFKPILRRTAELVKKEQPVQGDNIDQFQLQKYSVLTNPPSLLEYKQTKLINPVKSDRSGNFYKGVTTVLAQDNPFLYQLAQPLNKNELTVQEVQRLYYTPTQADYQNLDQTRNQDYSVVVEDISPNNEYLTRQGLSSDLGFSSNQGSSSMVEDILPSNEYSPVRGFLSTQGYSTNKAYSSMVEDSLPSQKFSSQSLKEVAALPSQRYSTSLQSFPKQAYEDTSFLEAHDKYQSKFNPSAKQLNSFEYLSNQYASSPNQALNQQQLTNRMSKFDGFSTKLEDFTNRGIPPLGIYSPKQTEIRSQGFLLPSSASYYNTASTYSPYVLNPTPNRPVFTNLPISWPNRAISPYQQGYSTQIPILTPLQQLYLKRYSPYRLNYSSFPWYKQGLTG